ncbi:MAG: HU family DNA-binding protein [Ktedonobacteraceae bacterium]
MYTSELIARLAKKNRRPQKFYHDAIAEILEGIRTALADGKEVRLMGFGTFYTRTKKGGKGMNFKTKKPMEYKSVRLAAFRAGSELKRTVRRKKGFLRR